MGDKAGHTMKGSKKGDKLGDKMGDKASGRPTKAQMWGENGRLGETRPREDGHAIQQRETRRKTS